MSDNQHPSYKNPTIQEALCEIRFTTANPDRFLVLLGEFAGRISGMFPTPEVFYDPLILEQAQGGTSGRPELPLAQFPFRPRIAFRHTERQIVLQLTPESVTVNVLPVYPGWETVKKDIMEAWANVTNVFNVTQVSRITLRYIDRVRTGEVPTATGWLSRSEFVPPIIAEARFPFTSQVRVQTGDDPNDALGLTLAYQTSPTKDDNAMIADFERVLDRQQLPSLPDLTSQIDRMHEEIWNAFVAVKGPRWNDILEEQP